MGCKGSEVQILSPRPISNLESTTRSVGSMKIFPLRITLLFSLAVLGACGSDSPTSTTTPSTARGTLVYDPPFRIASLDAASLQAQLAASAFAPFLPLTGAPACGVDFNYMQYWTVG